MLISTKSKHIIKTMNYWRRIIMTISRKLLIVGLLTLGLQQIAQAHTSEVACEAAQMLTFAQTLRTVNHKDALNVAQLLELRACDTSDNVQDCDIIAITNIINNPELSTQAKISILSQTIAAQRNQGIKNNIRRAVGTICSALATVAMIGCFGTLAIAIAANEAKYSHYNYTQHSLYFDPYLNCFRCVPSKPKKSITFVLSSGS